MSVNGKLTLDFIGLVIVFEIFVKAHAILSARPRWAALPANRRRLFLFSPLVAFKSVESARPINRLPPVLARLVIKAMTYGALLALFFHLYHGYWANHFEGTYSLSMSYLALPGAYLVGEFYGAVIQVLNLWTGLEMPSHHYQIFKAKNLGDFWGRRWNTWVSDWFRERVFLPMRRQPLKAMALVFFISGLGHELIINVPYYLEAGRSLLGSMMIYFGFQAMGLWIEKSVRFKGSVWSRVWLWALVLGPSPLIINEAVLRMFGFVPQWV